MRELEPRSDGTAPARSVAPRSERRPQASPVSAMLALQRTAGNRAAGVAAASSRPLLARNGKKVVLDAMHAIATIPRVRSALRNLDYSRWPPSRHFYMRQERVKFSTPITERFRQFVRAAPAEYTAPRVMAVRERLQQAGEDVQRVLSLIGDNTVHQQIEREEDALYVTNVTDPDHAARPGVIGVEIKRIDEHTLLLTVVGMGWNPPGGALLNEVLGSRLLFADLFQSIRRLFGQTVEVRTLVGFSPDAWDYVPAALKARLPRALGVLVELMRKQPDRYPHIALGTTDELIASLVDANAYWWWYDRARWTLEAVRHDTPFPLPEQPRAEGRAEGTSAGSDRSGPA